MRQTMLQLAGQMTVRRLNMGTMTITTVDPGTDAAEKALAFDPTRLTDGIESSDDLLPALRSTEDRGDDGAGAGRVDCVAVPHAYRHLSST